jgi:hypothetical protein
MKNKRLKKKIEETEDDSDLLDDSEESFEDQKEKKKRKMERLEEPEEEEDEPDEPIKRRERKSKDDFDFRIHHRHDTAMAKLLRARGVSPLDMMHGTKSFNLEDVVQPIASQAFGKLKKISVNKQLTWYEKSYQRVLGQSWLSAGISAFPTDARAKQLALHMFIRAIKDYQERDPRKNSNRSLPLWHHVYGGFGDPLRDLKSDYPSFVVVSNITPECTNLKIEKVRDILTKFNNMDIPVLVVAAGLDPYTLFATKFYYPMRWGVFVGNTTIQL